MSRLRPLALELATFAALAWFAAAHWASGLVSNAPGGRVFACVLIAIAVGVVLPLAEAAPTAQRWLLRAAGVVAGLGAGFVAIGLDSHFLAPAHWDELGDGLDRGFTALGSAQWPYDGSEPWASLVLLLAVPLVLVTAATLAFWGDRALRPAAVVLLVALYSVAVTEHQFDGELGRGALLLFLTAAWLWLPRLPERGSQAIAAAGATVLVACVAALPAAARYDDSEPVIDYESWNPFAVQATTSFDWSHDYGPIDWPRAGTTLMYVRSDERHYWKLETLDRFDGVRWERSGFGRGNNPVLPSPYNVVWETDLRFTIRDLDTNLFPVAGTALQITGADPNLLPSEDGTVEALDEPLEEGDTYFVEAYVPDPTPAEMRKASTYGLSTALFPYTEAGALPRVYDRVGALAGRLARGQPTTYDVVRAVQEHLRSEYIYDERPPRRPHPLAAFLLRDRAGYCQHFSGAMALMLRMQGIPARVAAGFTPGSYDADTEEYRVRDLDAHSWVEVWFEGIGWVPFDPTPSVAPAEAQSDSGAASAAGGQVGAAETPDVTASSDAEPGESGGTQGGARPGGPLLEGWMALVAIALLAGIALAIVGVQALLRRRMSAGEEEAELAALTRLLARSGEPDMTRLTLRQLERRLEAEPDAARYARMLRERRYGARGGHMPDTAARRHLRRALVRDRGLRAKLGALVAMPPLSFRRG